MTAETVDIVTEDLTYLTHGGSPLAMRIYRPAVEVDDGGQTRAAAPLPAVIDLHGGAWNKNDLSSCAARDAVLAASGLAVAAIDFRHGADGHLATMADINYAIRWLKAGAGRFGIDPARIGLCGQSSGGHLAMLAAMRPEDARYGATPLEEDSKVDASVRCVGMQWPVINPLSRYRHAQRERDAGAAWVGDIPENHDRYWGDEAAMEEGNPLLALERGEAVRTLPAMWIQGRPDIVHDYRDTATGQEANEPERFAAAYRAAGGEIELLYVDKEDASTAAAAFEPLARFFHAHL
jgi:acetyl esterase